MRPRHRQPSQKLCNMLTLSLPMREMMLMTFCSVLRAEIFVTQDVQREELDALDRVGIKVVISLHKKVDLVPHQLQEF